MSAEAIYTEVILEHNKSKHNRYVLSGATQAERGHNPNCGDDLTLFLELEGDTVKNASYEGNGCAISQASMSIMIDQIKGQPLALVEQQIDAFFRMIRGETLKEQEEDILGDAVLFEHLSKMPARVKCGTLGWHCLKTSLESSTNFSKDT